ncbi:hypothetical protein MMC07_000839 [Pseudocyphellaria aurata]|nr:hypothetical protein [Pseudocyphellaria aurata]
MARTSKKPTSRLPSPNAATASIRLGPRAWTTSRSPTRSRSPPSAVLALFPIFSLYHLYIPHIAITIINMDSAMNSTMTFDELVLAVTFEWPEYSAPPFPEYMVVEEPSSPNTTTTTSSDDNATTTTTTTNETATTSTTTASDDNADKSNVAPSKRGPRRRKKQPGAPKCPYVKRAHKLPAEPKREHNKITAGPPDMNNNAIATKESVTAALQKKRWYGGSGDEMFKKA